MANKELQGVFLGDKILLDRTDKAVQICVQNCYGKVTKQLITISLYEALYLLEKKDTIIVDKRNSNINFENFVKKAIRQDNRFLINYSVYKDMKKRGYIVKTALKYGAEFRIYDRGVKPGEDHAKWILYPVSEKEKFSWHEFSAKNRVAHSTKKNLLIGVVDDEQEVTYYEVGWTRP